jgi:hypothetical protein
MKMITITTISAIMGYKECRVSEQALEKSRYTAEQVNEGSMSSCVRKDHRKDKNPYLSRYGRDSWMGEIRKYSAMSGFMGHKNG